MFLSFLPQLNDQNILLVDFQLVLIDHWNNPINFESVWLITMQIECWLLVQLQIHLSNNPFWYYRMLKHRPKLNIEEEI
jgi:hypothetical protein